MTCLPWVAIVIRDTSILIAAAASLLQRSDTLKTFIPRGDARNQASCHPALLNGPSLMKYRKRWLPGGGPKGPSQLSDEGAQQVGRTDLRAHRASLVPSGPEKPGWTAQKDCASGRGGPPRPQPCSSILGPE